MLFGGALKANMGFPFSVTHDVAVVTVSRKEQALAFIVEQLVLTGRSPSLEEIARQLGVAKSRARDLVKALRHDGAVQQVPGAQRALTVPGLARRIAIEQLRREGYLVDEDILRVRTSTHVHLPLVAVIEHHPDDDRSQSHA